MRIEEIYWVSHELVCSLGGRKLSSGRLLEIAKLSGLTLELHTAQRFHVSTSIEPHVMCLCDRIHRIASLLMAFLRKPLETE